MFTLVRYAISVLIWVGIAALLLVLGKVVYLIFWTLVGLLLLVIWLGHMTYHVACWFNPDFKPIKIILAFAVVLIAGLAYFKYFAAPVWNTWGSTKEEIEEHYKADDYCPDAELRTVRTIEINVPRDYIFGWVRQLPEVDTYGFDFFDFRGKKRFERLVEDLPDLEEGDKFLLGRIVEIKKGRSITFDIGLDPKFPRLGVNCIYGGYYFRDIGGDRTRINMVMRADYDGFWGWFYSQVVIEFGDFFIASKQLSKLKKSAENSFNKKE